MDPFDWDDMEANRFSKAWSYSEVKEILDWCDLTPPQTKPNPAKREKYCIDIKVLSLASTGTYNVETRDGTRTRIFIFTPGADLMPGYCYRVKYDDEYLRYAVIKSLGKKE